MNLKESFRYQKFLDTLMRAASISIEQSDHSLKTTKIHNRNRVNPDALDVTEVVEVEDFYPNDQVIKFMLWLIDEKSKLTEAISKAKASIPFDIDAAVESNKLRQHLNSSIKTMIKHVGSKQVLQGRDYKFNVEGNQTPYIYDIDIAREEAYDRNLSKEIMRSVISDADKVSADIDSAMINTVVGYTPVFDVNDNFDDVMADFISKVLSE